MVTLLAVAPVVILGDFNLHRKNTSTVLAAQFPDLCSNVLVFHSTTPLTLMVSLDLLISYCRSLSFSNFPVHSLRDSLAPRDGLAFMASHPCMSSLPSSPRFDSISTLTPSTLFSLHCVCFAKSGVFNLMLLPPSACIHRSMAGEIHATLLPGFTLNSHPPPSWALYAPQHP